MGGITNVAVRVFESGVWSADAWHGGRRDSFSRFILGGLTTVAPKPSIALEQATTSYSFQVP